MRNWLEGVQIVYVLGAGHCGSTLLSLLLNAHSEMLGLSEISKIGRSAARPLRPPSPLVSEFWQRVASVCEQESGRSFLELCTDITPLNEMAALDSPATQRWVDSYGLLLATIARVSGKRVLVDASKGWEQLDLLRRLAPHRLLVLNLMRDGRAVSWAYARKGRRYGPSLRKFVSRVRGAARMRGLIPAQSWLDLRYEDLASAPERELRRICALVGVPYEPTMLAYRDVAWHGIGGNRMYRRADASIVLDTEWERRMPWRQRALFFLLAGRLNRRAGYASWRRSAGARPAPRQGSADADFVPSKRST